MISLIVSIDEQIKERLEKEAGRSAYRNFFHAAASVRKSAQQSIDNAPPASTERRRRRRRGPRRLTPSRAGTPIHTRRGQARRAIVFAADEKGAVIGPRYSVMGKAFAAHEFGLKYMGQDFPERPTMAPALEESLDRFADQWRGSIG